MEKHGGATHWEVLLDKEIAGLAGKRSSSAPLAGSPSRTQADTSPTRDESPPVPGEPVDAAGDGRYVTVQELRAEFYNSIQGGLTIGEDVYDEDDRLLLTAGSQITRRFLELLRERGIQRLRLRPGRSSSPPSESGASDEDGANDGFHTPLSRELDERLAGELQKPIVLQSVRAWRRPRLSVAELKTEAARGAALHTATTAAVTDLAEHLTTGRSVSAGDIRRSITHFVDMAAADFDLLPLIVAMQESQDEYLYEHGVNVAMLSMAVAAHLQLDRESMLQVGLGGLLHDVGMVRVPASIRLAPRSLNEEEWREIQRHPLHSLEMLANVRGLPQIVKLIVYQAHERTNGSGYPRGRGGKQIHPFAEIVSLADVYAAMTRQRPYRPARSPYEATTAILHDGAAGKFDRFLVRALLDTISLFPVGSFVELSDGSKARVLRANPGLHTRPVVETLTPDGAATGHVIDLSSDDSLRVVSAPRIDAA